MRGLYTRKQRFFPGKGHDFFQIRASGKERSFWDWQIEKSCA
jgi:hypothetical protein